jgi:hypothetical protein
MRYLWVVEMWDDTWMSKPSAWAPTVGCGLSREDARTEIIRWRTRNPGTKFRVQKYRAVQS